MATMPEPEPELEEVNFDDSTVLKYLCRADVDARGTRDFDAVGSGSSDVSGAGDRRLVGVRLLNPDRPLSASGLSTIYTMHFCQGGGPTPPLLAAGGKGGVVALFSTQVGKPFRLRHRGGSVASFLMVACRPEPFAVSRTCSEEDFDFLFFPLNTIIVAPAMCFL